MSQTQIDSINLQQCPVQNQVVPNEGPKAIPILLDFGITIAPDEIFLDYSQQQMQARFSLLQGMYIDNSNGGSAVTVTVEGTGFRTVCPATSQGFFVILCQNPIKLRFSSASGVVIRVFLLNFPVAPAVWAV